MTITGDGIPENTHIISINDDNSLKISKDISKDVSGKQIYFKFYPSSLDLNEMSKIDKDNFYKKFINVILNINKYENSLNNCNIFDPVDIN